MRQYLDLCQRVLDEGVVKPNRTGVDTIGIQGAMMQYDLADGFPAVTTKKFAYKPCFNEMLCFLQGQDNASAFRAMGCNVWDANANENGQWLSNPHRKGTDDLGRIYGVQARRWQYIDPTFAVKEIDQLANVVRDLSQGIDNRREIVTHWNPGEMDRMALPPCHLLYQFGIQDGKLNLAMYQRSCDMPLGVPFNIAGYAWLLHVISQITGLVPGVFTHFLFDVHVYVNQIDDLKVQLKREPKPLPILYIPTFSSLKEVEEMLNADEFKLVRYDHHPGIQYAFAV
jgi:thymidylate synthase